MFISGCERRIGNESVPTIIINDTIFLKTAVSILLILNYNSFLVLFDNILLPYILFEKYIHILALEMASPGNRHCASCIGTLSFATVCAKVVPKLGLALVLEVTISCRCGRISHYFRGFR